MKKFKNLIEKLDLNKTVAFFFILLLAFSLYSKGLDLPMTIIIFSLLIFFFIYRKLDDFLFFSIGVLFFAILAIYLGNGIFSNELGIAVYYLLLLVLIFSLGEELWKNRIKIAKKASQIYKNVIRWLHSCIFSKNK